MLFPSHTTPTSYLEIPVMPKTLAWSLQHKREGQSLNISGIGFGTHLCAQILGVESLGPLVQFLFQIHLSVLRTVNPLDKNTRKYISSNMAKDTLILEIERYRYNNIILVIGQLLFIKKRN
jgi:hypothetical protein